MIEAPCNHDNRPMSDTVCECGAERFGSRARQSIRVSDTPVVVYRQETRQGWPTVVSRHRTTLGAKRAYLRLEREFARDGYYPAEYGWENTDA